MRKPWLVLALLSLFGLGLAQAQPINQYVAVGAFPYNALGFCSLTPLSSSTSLASCSTQTATTTVSGVPTGANIIEVCVETSAVRYLDLNRAPTTTVGMPVSSGTCFQYSSSTLSQLSFIQQSASAQVDIYFFNGGHQ